MTVRLARGWNSVLVKVINRTGGFDLLGKIASPGFGSGVEGLQLAVARPPEVTAHNYPRTMIAVGPLTIDGPLEWTDRTLVTTARTPVTAWGAEPVTNVLVDVAQAGRAVATASFDTLVPATSHELTFELSLDQLQRAGTGTAPLVGTVTRGSVADGAPVFIDADQVMRLWGGRIVVGTPRVDSVSDTPIRLRATVVVPPAFEAQTVDLLTLGMGPNANYGINRTPGDCCPGRWPDSRSAAGT